MTQQVDMRIMELLCSRLCHDLVGPVGAVNNGIELVAETRGDVQSEATQMIAHSAQEALGRLEFFRMAFGLSGGGEGFASLAHGRALARGLLDSHFALDWPDNPDLRWNDQAKEVPKDIVKIILNMVMLGRDSLPRGGVITVSTADLPEGLGVALMCRGQKAQVRDDIQHAMQPDVAAADITAQTVQAYFFAQLLADLNVDFEMFSPESDSVQLAAIIGID